MYLSKNGSRSPVSFSMSESMPVKSTDEMYDSSRGSNKMMLYLALVAILIVACVSGWMLFRHIQKSDKKDLVGYRLH